MFFIAAMPELEEEKKHYLGHRERLRQKFRKSPKVLTDCEILELFLFHLISYKDTKPIAKKLMSKFTNFKNIADAEESELCQIEGIGPSTAFAFKIYGEMVQRRSAQTITKIPLINSWKTVIDYCKVHYANKPTEEVHTLFLNHKYYLIGDELMFYGTVNESPLYTREIIRRALALNASFFILVHNHPSGDATPSAEDIYQTRKLYHAGKVVGINLIDHFIVAKNSYTSLRNLGIISDTILPPNANLDKKK